MTDLVWADAATPDEGAAQAADLFRDAFGYEPRGVWSAPGRVNIIGEHVDYNGGPCVPIALPHRAYVALSPREDRTIRLISPQTRDAIDVLDLDVIGPKGTPGEVLTTGPRTSRVSRGRLSKPDMARCPVSTLPYGRAFLWVVGSRRAPRLSARRRSPWTRCVPSACAGTIEAPSDEGRKVLVDAARAAENQVAGANTGGLDQTASLRCREGYALALDCRDMSTRQVPFDLGAVGLELLVIDTRAKHSLADGQYGSRRADCEESARMLGVEQLVDVEDLDEAMAALGDERLAARTRHVVSEIARTRAFIELLDEGPLEGTRLAVAGALMNDSHDSLRDDYEVSCAELDVAVDAARAAGAHGARMTGGGFGGSAIALVDADAVMSVARAVAAAYAERGWEPPHFIRALPGAPAGRLD